MAELKTCPFCGSKDIKAVTGKCCIKGEMYYEYYVTCENCHAMTDYGDNLEDAINRWNQRAVKKGMWLYNYYPDEHLEYSECQHEVPLNEKSNFCPACGTKMK